jgi:DNA-binding response OmpR family regulator
MGPGSPTSSSSSSQQRHSSLPTPKSCALVVDDDPDTLVILGKLLSLIGVDALPALTCDAARCAARTQGTLGIAIADVTLPDGNGLALLAEFKRQYGCRTIAISGWAKPADGLPDGVDLWIEKPVEVARLHGAVKA